MNSARGCARTGRAHGDVCEAIPVQVENASPRRVDGRASPPYRHLPRRRSRRADIAAQHTSQPPKHDAVRQFRRGPGRRACHVERFEHARARSIQAELDAGAVRLDDMYLLDFRVDKAFTFGTARVTPSMDIFNLTNVNTVLARRRLQGASNANNISGIVAPRVIRFGVRVNW